MTTLATLDSVTLTQGLAFLYAQAEHALREWQQTSFLTESPQKTPPPDIPPIFPTTFTPLQVHFPVLANLERPLSTAMNGLMRYVEGSGIIDPTDENLLWHIDTLRCLVETVYQQDLTFLGENRHTTEKENKLPHHATLPHDDSTILMPTVQNAGTSDFNTFPSSSSMSENNGTESRESWDSFAFSPQRFWSLPEPSSPDFTGRGTHLNILKDTLTTATKVVITPAHDHLNTGGIGMSRLATEYAYTNLEQYDIVWWIPAETPAAVPDRYAELVRCLGYLPEKYTPEEIILLTAQALSTRQRWLLIFDGVKNWEDLLSIFPFPAFSPITGHVLITSRNTEWPNSFDRVGLCGLPKEKAARLLSLHIGHAEQNEQDNPSINALAHELDGHPLALKRAGAAIAASSLQTEDFFRRFNAHQTARHTHTDANEKSNGKAEDAFLTTYETILYTTTARPTAEAAAQLLHISAFLGEAPLPFQLFLDHLNVLPRTLRKVMRKKTRLQEMKDLLCSYSLSDDNFLFLHNLEQCALIERLLPTHRIAWAEKALDLIFAALPSHTGPETWEEHRKIAFHALPAAQRAAQLDITNGNITAKSMRIFNHMGNVFFTRKDFPSCKSCREQAHELQKHLHGEHHANIATTLTALGQVALASGDYDTAAQVLNQAVQVNEETFGPHHFTVAAILANLGIAEYKRDEIENARDVFQRVLTIQEKNYNSNPEDLIRTLHNLGTSEWALNHTRTAKQYLERAREISEQIHGSEHPNLGVTLLKLGQIAYTWDDVQQATAYLKRGLQILEKNGETSSMDVCNARDKLAQIEQAS